MKKNYVTLLLSMALFCTVVPGCKKDGEGKEKYNAIDASKMVGNCEGKVSLKGSELNAKSQSLMSTSSASVTSLPYKVTLLTRQSNGDGTYTWIWSVENPNPGNGKDGKTVQDLSHWAISIGNCATLADIANAATSTDGQKWTSFKPTYSIDKSQSCYQQPILKFDVGTKGTAKVYYKLVMKKNFTMEKQLALYKSGANTGCGTFQICGIGSCPEK